MRYILEKPKLSILVASYNIENYIAEALDSLLNQKYKNIEIIVVDDGSTDGTRDILKQYEERWKIKLIFKENGGTSTTRNECLKHFTGDFVVFMDGDDVIDPDSYSENIKYLIDDPELDMVEFPIMFAWTTSRAEVNKIKPYITSSRKEIYELYLQQQLTFSMCDKIFRCSALKNLKFLEGVLYEDVNSNEQVIGNIKKIRLSDKGLYYYRRTSNSNITRKMTYQKMHDYFYTTLRFLNKAQNQEVDNVLLYKYLSRWLRLEDFLLYDELDEDQQNSLIELTGLVPVSKFELLRQILSAKISYRKFSALWSFSNGSLSKAIQISNPKKTIDIVNDSEITNEDENSENEKDEILNPDIETQQ